MGAAPQFQLPGFTSGIWHGEPVEASYDIQAGILKVVSGAETDWNIDALTDQRSDSAPALLFEIDGDFALSACVAVEFFGTFDAGILCVRSGPFQWAKLCFERSPARQPMIVSVVTEGVSDDANSVIVEGDEVWLRVSRFGDACVFHYSLDGLWWHFVRQFRLMDGAKAKAGFLSQSPFGKGTKALFRDIKCGTVAEHDLRDGS